MGWQVEVWERLAPQLGVRNLVMLACTHHELKKVLKEDSIWKASLRTSVDIGFALSLNAEDGLTWRYLAMQVLEGLSSLQLPSAEVSKSSALPPNRAFLCNT